MKSPEGNPLSPQVLWYLLPDVSVLPSFSLHSRLRWSCPRSVPRVFSGCILSERGLPFVLPQSYEFIIQLLCTECLCCARFTLSCRRGHRLAIRVVQPNAGCTLEAVSFPPRLEGLAQFPWRLHGRLFSVQGPESARAPECHSGSLQGHPLSQGPILLTLPISVPQIQVSPFVPAQPTEHHSPPLCPTPDGPFALFYPSLSYIFGKSKFHP